MEGGEGVIDIDKITVLLEPDKISEGGLHIPGKDRVVFRPPERKSVLGLDALAIAKRESKGDGGFKVPQDRNISVVTSLDEDEKSSLSGFDDAESNSFQGRNTRDHRRYRETHMEETSHSVVFSTISDGRQDGNTRSSHPSNVYQRSEVTTPHSGSSRSLRSRSPSRYERESRTSDRRDRNEARSESRRGRHDDDGYHGEYSQRRDGYRRGDEDKYAGESERK